MTDDLLRDLEAVVALLDAPDNDLYAESVYKAARFIRAHHAEIAEAVKDARRYRWLRESANVSWNGYVEWQNLVATDVERAAMDAAIDAAMRNSEREDETHD